jgi:hypothetical protein
MAEKICLSAEQRAGLAKLRSAKIGENIRRGYLEADNYPSYHVYPSRGYVKKIIPKPITRPSEKQEADELASFVKDQIAEREEFLRKTLDYLLEGATKGDDKKRINCENLIEDMSGDVSLEFRNRYAEKYNLMLDSYERVCQLRQALVKPAIQPSTIASTLDHALEAGANRIREAGANLKGITHKILLNFTQQVMPPEEQNEQLNQA